MTHKHVDLALPLIAWNLENYSSSFKINIEEVDAIESYEVTQATACDFATNFEFSILFGEKVKIGPKFGISQKNTQTIAFKSQRTNGNDELGEVVIDFGDEIITSRNITLESISIDHRSSGNYYARLDYNNKYYTGWYRVQVAPIRTSGSDTYNPRPIATPVDLNPNELLIDSYYLVLL